MRSPLAQVDLRFADSADLPMIAGFLPELGGPYFHEPFPGKTAREFCEWKYFRNPLGSAVVVLNRIGMEPDLPEFYFRERVAAFHI